ncbi:MAG: glycosyltransferase family 4 protein [Gemmatimonadota bacterium]|nr:glycosyltransferase family 4 protein [Gemmatimonadota bacterium]
MTAAPAGSPMRILFVNDGVGDAGGVQRYLEAVAGAMRRRGHAIALLHLDRLRAPDDSPVGAEAAHFCIAELGTERAVAAAVSWRPTVVFSHNMRALDADRLLCARAPVVKMMHAYSGTCIGAQKMHSFPRRVACDRRFGFGCVLLYFPRHCSEGSVHALASHYAWAREQRAIWDGYRRVIVASDHMRREYERNGIPAGRLATNPLFASDVPAQPAPAPQEFGILFLGRMTALKGGDQLVRAAHLASRQIGQPVRLTMAGDGPARRAWERLSATLGVNAEFPGWVTGTRRDALYHAASLVAVPSLWPEPFGLTGLEAGAHGVPAVAFDVGGIRAWLRDGENGWLVDPRSGARGMARALVEAWNNPGGLAERRSGARRVAERLSLDRHVTALETLLAEAGREAAT